MPPKRGMKRQKAVREIEKECEELCSQLKEKYDRALCNIPEKFHDLVVEDYDDRVEHYKNLVVEDYNDLVEEDYNDRVEEDYNDRVEEDYNDRVEEDYNDRVEEDYNDRVEEDYNDLVEEDYNDRVLAENKVKSNSKKSVYNTCKRYTESSSADPKLFRTPLASVQQINTPMNHRSDIFMTPLSRSAPKQKMLVRPKFDPRLPLPNMLLRKPRPNEVIISLSGSPLQNPAVSENDKPGVFLVVGKVLNLADVSELNLINIDNLANEILKMRRND